MRPLKLDPQKVHAAHASAFALGTAMICYAEAEEVVRPLHLEQARIELVRAANALGCTVKVDDGGMVLIQATEMRMIAAAQGWGDNVVARAAEADSLRRRLDASVRVNGELQARINELERAADRGTDFRGLEDKALWAPPAAA